MDLAHLFPPHLVSFLHIMSLGSFPTTWSLEQCSDFLVLLVANAYFDILAHSQKQIIVYVHYCFSV